MKIQVFWDVTCPCDYSSRLFERPLVPSFLQSNRTKQSKKKHIMFEIKYIIYIYTLTVEPCYNNIGLYDTTPIQSDIL
jgi:hypothetical protein